MKIADVRCSSFGQINNMKANGVDSVLMNVVFGQCIRLIEETSVIGKEELELFIERSMFQIEQNRVDEDTEGRSPSVFGRKRLRVRALSAHGCSDLDAIDL